MAGKKCGSGKEKSNGPMRYTPAPGRSAQSGANQHKAAKTPRRRT